MADKPYLLSDDEIISFIIQGSHIVEPDFPDGFNESIYAELEALDIPRNNPGDGILDKVPKLYQVYDHPKVRGALVSLLGEDVQMNGHRHCHVKSARHPESVMAPRRHKQATSPHPNRFGDVLSPRCARRIGTDRDYARYALPQCPDRPHGDLRQLP